MTLPARLDDRIMAHAGLGGPSPTLRVSAFLLVGLVVAAIAGASLARLEIVARGQGKTVPTSSIRTVQAQLGGKIERIAIKEGDIVKAGDALLRLDDVAQIAERDSLREQLRIASAQRFRAEAALTAMKGNDVAATAFMPAALSAFDTLAAEMPKAADQRALLETELLALQASVQETDAREKTLAADNDLAKSRRDKAEAMAAIEKTVFDAAQKLAKNGTLSPIELAKRRSPYEDLRREVDIQTQEMAGKKAAIDLLRQNRAVQLATARQQWQAERDKAMIAIDDLNNRLKTAERNLAFTEIRAPVSGKIEDLKTRTEGGRLAEGETIAKIVPVGDPLEIEAMLDSQEASFIAIGQPVYVSFDAYPAERYTRAHGTVRDISADTVNIPNKGWGYVVHVRLDEPMLKLPSGDIPLSTGMTANVDVVTGMRPMISYLFEPIVRSMMEGGRER
jgi:HlyD family type I secretion membrane fusion protein